MSPIGWNNLYSVMGCAINSYLKMPRCLYKPALCTEAIFKSQKLPEENSVNMARNLEPRILTQEPILGSQYPQYSHPLPQPCGPLAGVSASCKFMPWFKSPAVLFFTFFWMTTVSFCLAVEIVIWI